MKNIQSITQTIEKRSRKSRAAYMDMVARSRDQNPPLHSLSCSNVAHVVAASSAEEKRAIAGGETVNVGIVTAYNDMLSAHQPLATYPDLIKRTAAAHGATAQVAGGVPAMCDGVTQGQPGMSLSLFSRDVIAMGTAIALSHNSFDAVLCLGVCDKIVPGMLMGALQFGHLPTLFIPAGPMPSGIPNAEKAAARQRFAEGKIDRIAMLEVESASYHSPGTCTFYGTANTNQLLMEIMGLQLPSTSFINAGTPLRDHLTIASVERVVALAQAERPRPLAEVVSAAAIVNGMVGLLATGGSTNHSIHLIAMARAAGLIITWDDLSALSAQVPLLARMYPNGQADVNHFRDAGGTAFLIGELRRAGLLNEDVMTVMGEGLAPYEREPMAEGEALGWSEPVTQSRNPAVLRAVADPFDPSGGIRTLEGNLGRAIVKVSAVPPERRRIEAPCVIFHSQEELKAAFEAGDLHRDVVAVVRFQGPQANGMPELHKMTPLLASVQSAGHSVALLTDGRMSGASGAVLAAIHTSPEACAGGPLALLQDGDLISIDADKGTLRVSLSEKDLEKRKPASPPPSATTIGRALFAPLRRSVGTADTGGSLFDDELFL